MDFGDKLLKLQEDIYNSEIEEREEYLVDFSPKIGFAKAGGGYDITYFGDGYDDDGDNFAFASLLELLIANASKIKSLYFTGADEGANGTKNWDFTRLINSDAIFDNLESFKVKLTDAGDHNQSIIASSYDEEGQIAKLVAKAPNLKILQVPSAPNEEFFRLKNLKLQELIVQAGYDTQNFIANLSECGNLRGLYSFDWTDILNDIDNIGSGYNEYKKLFSSDFFETKDERGRHIYFHFKLRENKLTAQELQELAAIKKIQFLYIRLFGGKYIE
ncbi:MAG: hypothetical protein LBC09_00870 [Helicobacteraceae bacterium]|jgi:hypothetical protein|nr:hypothetical protein [Helicobacteraceae bacterium]